MTTTRLNRWLKPLAILLVIVLIVMLLIPRELTDAELAQIKPGMTMDEARLLLGEATDEWNTGTGFLLDSNEYRLTLTSKGKFWKPTRSVTVSTENGQIVMGQQVSKWHSKNHLLWVQQKNGMVVKTTLLPITCTGGGIEGCIETIKECWNQWWK